MSKKLYQFRVAANCKRAQLLACSSRMKMKRLVLSGLADPTTIRFRRSTILHPSGDLSVRADSVCSRERAKTRV